jgi:hypothetical protein
MNEKRMKKWSIGEDEGRRAGEASKTNERTDEEEKYQRGVRELFRGIIGTKVEDWYQRERREQGWLVSVGKQRPPSGTVVAEEARLTKKCQLFSLIQLWQHYTC